MLIFIVLTIFGCTWVALHCATQIRKVLLLRDYVAQLGTYQSMLEKYHTEAEKCDARGDGIGRVQALKAHREVKMMIIDLTARVANLK